MARLPLGTVIHLNLFQASFSHLLYKPHRLCKPTLSGQGLTHSPSTWSILVSLEFEAKFNGQENETSTELHKHEQMLERSTNILALNFKNALLPRQNYCSFPRARPRSKSPHHSDGASPHRHIALLPLCPAP